MDIILRLQKINISLFNAQEMKMVFNSPFMEEVLEYSVTTDALGRSLDGGNTYKMHLPKGIPNVNFWSVIVYDLQTHLMISTDQPWPSVYSSCKKLVTNPDASLNTWFGPEIPAGSEGNWVKTIPGKEWYLVVRLYGLKEVDNDTSWKPGDIGEVK